LEKDIIGRIRTRYQQGVISWRQSRYGFSSVQERGTALSIERNWINVNRGAIGREVNITFGKL
jgi:hypothetical protein